MKIGIISVLAGFQSLLEQNLSQGEFVDYQGQRFFTGRILGQDIVSYAWPETQSLDVMQLVIDILKGELNVQWLLCLEPVLSDEPRLRSGDFVVSTDVIWPARDQETNQVFHAHSRIIDLCLQAAEAREDVGFRVITGKMAPVSLVEATSLLCVNQIGSDMAKISCQLQLPFALLGIVQKSEIDLVEYNRDAVRKGFWLLKGMLEKLRDLDI